MTTELDRYTKLVMSLAESYRYPMSEEDRKELESLKSQIESKLAQADGQKKEIVCCSCPTRFELDPDCKIHTPSRQQQADKTLEQELSQLREEKRLTNNMVKFVVCIKCNRHRTPYGFYPNKPCECGSHESEERDTTLEELFAESQELSQLRPIVQKILSKNISLYKEALETIEKIQFGKELDKFDSSNLQYTIEDLLQFILEKYESILATTEDKTT